MAEVRVTDLQMATTKEQLNLRDVAVARRIWRVMKDGL